MDVFDLRDRLIDDYADYVRSFVPIRDPELRTLVDRELDSGLLWPQPRLGLNPAYEEGASIPELCDRQVLHEGCRDIFRVKAGGSHIRDLNLFRHQVEAIESARRGVSYVLTTGTGSGKSLSYIIPIVDAVLREKDVASNSGTPSAGGIRAIVVYPMNALANSQENELKKFLGEGGPVTFHKYTGQEDEDKRHEIWLNPPDILLTNYVMLELILTRVDEEPMVKAAQGLRYIVFDELHTYRGRQGADVALLARRARVAFGSPDVQMVGTSATMASGGGYEEQRHEVATLASRLFGVPVTDEAVIGETLRRATPEIDVGDPEIVAALARSVDACKPSESFEELSSDPLSSWIESTFGVTSADGRLIRATPRTLEGPGGAAVALSEVTGRPELACAAALRQYLLTGSRVSDESMEARPLFAFRLHQFLSRGDTVYATVESPPLREFTFTYQLYVPDGDNRRRAYFPLTFCRWCGQEYYSVTLEPGDSDHVDQIVFRDPSGRSLDKDHDRFLYIGDWPEVEDDEFFDRIPDAWLEETRAGTLRMKSSYKKSKPLACEVAADGTLSQGGTRAWLVPVPFRFCLACGVTYSGQQRSDLPKLTTLGAGGRSSATTIISLGAVRALKGDEILRPQARKLLAFTDNRQDASLQAGHFNDFVEVGLIRSGLCRAVDAAGDTGIRHEDLAAAVFSSLGLDFGEYASNPDARFQARANTEAAMRDVIGYRVFYDQRRGWRVTAPNLEQTGLLAVDYESLSEVCADSDLWATRHRALSSIGMAERDRVCRTLLDFVRRELAIKVDYLSASWQERLKQVSSQWLASPWAIDEEEKLESAAVLYPRSRRDGDYKGHVYLSARGGFGQFLRRTLAPPGSGDRLGLVETTDIIEDLLDILVIGGILERVEPPRGENPAGYQLVAGSLVWKPGNGTPAEDPIRMPRPPEGGIAPNQFFVRLYKDVASDGAGFEAREHTAQVPYDIREKREDEFREGKLPVLFCSPTMELGIDISDLNVVGLRNVPPTPANYAQRSGRAGRQGQPALIFTYCTAGSPHDQFFFRNQDQMIAGQVTPPRLDLSNEDLVRSHVQAIWLSQTHKSLGKSLTDVMDVGGQNPTLDFTEDVERALESESARADALVGAKLALDDLIVSGELAAGGWWSEHWLEEALRAVPLRFEQACERWKGLYQAAIASRDAARRVMDDASRPAVDRKGAERRHREAISQLEILRADVDRRGQSDFYSYRYFAAEGFLPGYSFPRLPLSAFIPGRSTARGSDEFLQRPRFIAIKEFGPQNFIYHEGSRYAIDRVIIPASEHGEGPLLSRAKVCDACGYFHRIEVEPGPDRCEACDEALPVAMDNLLRLQNVATKRRDRINSDEEERRQEGYNVTSAVRFSQHGPLKGKVSVDGEEAGLLTYGHAATIWRINKGWRRVPASSTSGFDLDPETGRWGKNPNDPEESNDDGLGPRHIRVVPYVEDTRNCLILEPVGLPPEHGYANSLLASLQAALKAAIQVEFQLEDSELAAEPLPAGKERRRILFYEAAEGGAGVLRRLIDEPDALARMAASAIKICHAYPFTGEDREGACQAGCYRCILSYYNQTDHRIIDRRLAVDHLLPLTQARVEAAGSSDTVEGLFSKLMRPTMSELEREWLNFIHDGGWRLPSDAGRVIEAAECRPDFLYDPTQLAVFVDGPVHDGSVAGERDPSVTARLMRVGWSVIRFRYDERAHWAELVGEHPNTFGKGRL